jgi:hypothetical protein
LISYQDIADPGLIDQTVTLKNRSDEAIVPVIKYKALDADGDPVPGIKVETAYGSDRGLLVVATPGGTDVLVFSGDRVDDVVGVEAVVQKTLDAPDMNSSVQIEPELFSHGSPVTKLEAFDEMKLTNTSRADVALRVVCLVYDRPSPGNAQQADEVTVVLDRVELAAGETVSTGVTESFAQRTAVLGFGCDTIKAQLTP